MSRLELSLFPGSVVEAPADTILVPIPEDERPLRGDAGLVDWRLCGRISEQLRSGYVSGQLGEAALLPGARPLSPARILLVGVGAAPPRGMSRPILRAMRTAAAKLLMMRSPAALLACPGAVDFAEDAVSLLRGLVHGLAETQSDLGLHVILPDGGRKERALLSALGEVVPGAHSWGVSLHVNWVDVDGEELKAPASERVGILPTR
ncbi:MAG TPA: M17 family peptidase N-terminal domain-containing protein [Myxococcota bacterium]|nr:M17 family peptidase N-terminal domain-containing protein [Myxococcota bacterium]